MQLTSEIIELTCPESDIYNRLSLDNKHILELGCGSAVKTRDIAKTGVKRQVTALEVDEIAHKKNMQISDLPNVKFVLAGAQDIPLEDESVDAVFMFKSLHHVPADLMEPSMHEIRRVLKPGGLAYISEPVFAGEYNEILRLFHDEQKVREQAFNTLTKVVSEGLFSLLEETFFYTPVHFEDFTAFENDTIKVTYGDYRMDDDLYNLVRQRFGLHMGDDGAHFKHPVRVDLLQKP